MRTKLLHATTTRVPTFDERPYYGLVKKTWTATIALLSMGLLLWSPACSLAGEVMTRVVVPAKRQQVPIGVVDPDCSIASCNPNICVGLPPATVVKSASLWVQEAGLPLLGPCERHPSGEFMDCAALRKPNGAALGYVRSIGPDYSVSDLPDGPSVCWKAKNWADVPRAVELHVQY
jgi:hypothetical protein